MKTILEFFGNDQFNMWAYGSFVISHTIYWVTIAAYTVLDLSKNAKALKKYSTRPNDFVDIKLLLKAICVSLFNQIFVAFPIIFIASMFNDWFFNGQYPSLELPSIPKMIYQFIGCLLAYEAIFYYNHRLLHTKQMYKRFHKPHHFWKHPIAASTMYCHPVEHILTSTLPHILGPFIIQPNIFVAWAYYAFAMMLAIHDHTGYHLPFFKSQEFHDFHHLKFVNNFGVFGILDWLHGTDKIWKKSKNYQRHYVITNFVPAKIEYPDE